MTPCEAHTVLIRVPSFEEHPKRRREHLKLREGPTPSSGRGADPWP